MTSLRSSRGMSLVEVVMATFIVGVVIVGALHVVGSSVRTRKAASDQNHGARLAEQLLAEIISQPYEDPEGSGSWGAGSGPDAGESSTTRIDFDDVDDYDDWDATVVQDKYGNALPEFAGWTRSANVVWADRIGGNPWLSDTGLKRIEVNVTSPSGATTTRWAYRYQTGSLQQPPSADATVVTMISGELTIGDSTTVSRASTNIINHAADPNSP